MKKDKFIIIAVLVLFTCSCKREKVKAPNFNVTTAALTYHVGDTITFNFTGNPDFITFWSGEKGHDYNNRNRLGETGIRQTLDFTSWKQSGNQPGDLYLKVSTDFDGVYAPADIAKATWTDISNRAVFSTGTTVYSGPVDLTDFGKIGGDFYFAFYYHSLKNTTSPTTWIISADTITNVLADSTVSYTVNGFANTSFIPVNIQNNAHNWVVGLSNLTMVPGNVTDSENEDWAISRPLDLNTVALPDYGVPIKTIDVFLSSYKYAFAAPGSYNVTFWAANDNIYGAQSVIKQMTIVITP